VILWTKNQGLSENGNSDFILRGANDELKVVIRLDIFRIVNPSSRVQFIP
jgi:hypothetical protein